jgi:hypothetical protein
VAPSELYNIKRYRKTKHQQIDDKRPKVEEALCDSAVWQRLVWNVPEFGVKGRIMAARFIDGPKIWMRLQEILRLVDTQLGISDPGRRSWLTARFIWLLEIPKLLVFVWQRH